MLALFFNVALVAGHSWPENPVPRHRAQILTDELCVKMGDGSDFLGKNGQKICGKDAQGLDIRNLRPDTWESQPCTYTRGEGGYNNEFEMTKVVQGSPLCVMWAANAHDGDETRNGNGGIKVAMVSAAEPTQADFTANVIAKDIPYEHFRGVKVQVPAELTPGTYTLQWQWDWPVPGANHLYSNCADIEVVATEAEVGDVQSLGLPVGFKPTDDHLAKWKCNAADPVFSVADTPSLDPVAPPDNVPAPDDGNKECAKSAANLIEDGTFDKGQEAIGTGAGKWQCEGDAEVASGALSLTATSTATARCTYNVVLKAHEDYVLTSIVQMTGSPPLYGYMNVIDAESVEFKDVFDISSSKTIKFNSNANTEATVELLVYKQQAGTLAVSDISLAAAGAADCPELEAAPTPADDDQDKDATAGSVRGGVVGVWTAALLAAHLLLVACAQ